ncbi:MAG TPA: HD domain-containing phosphohydrolase [Bradyrhizobium sp.]|jgi:putative nucleotidyltransferase with HDIG domain|nr:HD domain-containing phosphohydrolase [Bradyrhizobium sp.]
MFVHIVAERQNQISELHEQLGTPYRVTSALLDGESGVPSECDAIIVAADLRRANNVTMLRGMAGALRSAHRRIFIVDQKARLCAAQAYALNATHVLFNPVYEQTLIRALTGSDGPKEPSRDMNRGARQAAADGAVSLASMFAVVKNGQQVDVADVKHAGDKICDAIAEDGFSEWLETVRRHHEGTYQHCLLVTGTAAAFGLDLGLANADVERLYSAAMFHDIGKAKIPLAVLDKPGSLDDRERAVLETHAAIGYDALRGSPGISSEILDAVRHHHEYLDGSGYPDGLGAAGISDLVRILTISDIFAALIEDRPYKPPMPRAKAYKILTGMRGKLEMPLVGAFKDVALNL